MEKPTGAGRGDESRLRAGPSLPPRGVAAHRGGARDRPENTLSAFRHAASLGAHQIELDVRRCASGDLVVMHDPTVDRTTDGSGAVADLSLAALRRLDAGRHFGARYAGERIPTLHEAIEAIPTSVWINVQVKFGEPIGAQVARCVADHGAAARVILACGNAAGREARTVLPELALCNLVRKESRLEYLEHAASEAATFVQFHHLRGAPTPDEIERARRLELHVNHVGPPGVERDPDALAELFRVGVDFVLVDEVEPALAAAAAEGIPPGDAVSASRSA